MNFIEFATQKASQCGWRITEYLSDTMVSMTFETEMGDEKVYIRPCGQNSDGNTVIEFSSQGVQVPDDIANAALFALALLERNGEMLFGHWGIEKVGRQKFFTVFATQIANTLDADEFKGAVRAVLNERKRLNKEVQKSSINF